MVGIDFAASKELCRKPHLEKPALAPWTFVRSCQAYGPLGLNCTGQPVEEDSRLRRWIRQTLFQGPLAELSAKWKFSSQFCSISTSCQEICDTDLVCPVVAWPVGFLDQQGLEKVFSKQAGAQDCQFKDWSDWGRCQLQPCGPVRSLEGPAVPACLAWSGLAVLHEHYCIAPVEVGGCR